MSGLHHKKYFWQVVNATGYFLHSRRSWKTSFCIRQEIFMLYKNKISSDLSSKVGGGGGKNGAQSSFELSYHGKHSFSLSQILPHSLNLPLSLLQTKITFSYLALALTFFFIFEKYFIPRDTSDCFN